MSKEILPIKLTSNNYFGWSQLMMNYLGSKKLQKFILHETFETYFEAEYPPTTLQVTYQTRKIAIETNRELNDQQKLDALDQLNDKFLSNLTIWEQQQTNARRTFSEGQEQTCSIIRQYVDQGNSSAIAKIQNAKLIWDLIKTRSTSSDTGALVLLHQQLFLMELNQGETLCSYVDRAQEIMDKMTLIGENVMTQPLVCYKVLSSLGKEYDNVTQTLYQTKKEDLTLDYLRLAFGAEDSRRDAQCKQQSQLQIKANSITNNNNNNNTNNSNNSSNSNRTPKQRLCSKCKSILPKKHPKQHFLCNKCFDSKKKSNQQQQQSTTPQTQQPQQQQTASQQQHQQALQVANQASRKNETHNVVHCGNAELVSNRWYLDSGCTSHLTNNSEELSDTRASNMSLNGPTGEESSTPIVGTHYFNINNNNNEYSHTIQFNNTYYNPMLKRKLLSVSRICVNGAKVLFEENEASILNSNYETIAKAHLERLTGLYYLSDQLQSTTETRLHVCNSTLSSPISLTELHYRFGHLAKDTLLRLSENNALNGLTIKDKKEEINCRICDIVNMTRTKFEKKKRRQEYQLGESWHTDVCGPINIPTLNNESYFVTFTEEKEDYGYVHLLKNRSEVFDLFINLRKLVKTQLNVLIKNLVCDGGGEYLSNEFKEFMKKKGINYELNPPNTPQRNGVSERKNRTLFAMSRAMLKSAKLPQRFWGEGILYSNLLRNRTVKKNQSITRLEATFNIIPSFKYLNIFGCEVTYRDNYEKRKLDDRARKGIFLGINESSNTYRVYDLEKKRVFSAREVVFYNNDLIKSQSTSFKDEFNVKEEVSDLMIGEEEIKDEQYDEDDYYFEEEEEEEEEVQPILIHNHQNNNNFNRPNDQPPIQQVRVMIENVPTINLRRSERRKTTARENNYVYSAGVEGNDYLNLPPPVCNVPHYDTSNSSYFNDTNSTMMNVSQIKHAAIMDAYRDAINVTHAAYAEDNANDPVLLSLGVEDKLEVNLPPSVCINPSRGDNNNNLINLNDTNTSSVYNATINDSIIEPRNYAQAIKLPGWKESINDELNSLIQNGTWELVDRPLNTPIVRPKWVFKVKRDKNNVPYRLKSRLVAMGNTQTHGIDYDATYSPVISIDTLRYVIAYTNGLDDVKIWHLDADTAFLNPTLTESIYMSVPEGLDYPKDKVLKLIKSIYGLKQSSRNWYNDISNYLTTNKFIKSRADPCLFIREDNSWLMIYVDDMKIVGKLNQLVDIKKVLGAKYKLKDMGPLSYAIGIMVEKKEDSISISQSNYILSILDNLNMTNTNTAHTPSEALPTKEEILSSPPLDSPDKFRKAVGSLLYLSNCTRPDISFTVHHIARSMANPTVLDWKRVLRVFRYLKGTINAKLVYNLKDGKLIAYSDASYADDQLERKSTSGYCFIMNGAAVSWSSTKQSITALSTAEAEYIGLADCTKQALWFNQLRDDLKLIVDPIIINEDNESAIAIAKGDDGDSRRTKHINVKFHLTREKVKSGEIVLQSCNTTDMVADIFTKPLGKILHYKHSKSLGLIF
jgi:hypothetical protein